MSIWDTYPLDYRQVETEKVISAIRAGECVSVVGLSGSGKSNFMGFLAYRASSPAADDLSRVLVDCNRMVADDAASFFQLTHRAIEVETDRRLHRTKGNAAEDEVLGQAGREGLRAQTDALTTLEKTLSDCLNHGESLSLLFDRFDALAGAAVKSIHSNLRAMRDAYKYQLTYVTGSRRPLDPASELAELFFANTLWLGPLSEKDARWSATRYAQRKGLAWDESVIRRIIDLTWGYPSFLRAACEAYAAGVSLEAETLRQSSMLQQRLREFWADQPAQDDLIRSGLAGHPLLERPSVQLPAQLEVDQSQLTAKEHLLLQYFMAHPDQVCEKDDLIRAIWPEDRIYTEGIRDDSLAQIVRRLRKKIEPDADHPLHIHTIPGRGYRFKF